jgi:hypothetical protein
MMIDGEHTSEHELQAEKKSEVSGSLGGRQVRLITLTASRLMNLRFSSLMFPCGASDKAAAHP